MYSRVSGKPRKLSNGNVQVETWSGLFELPSDGSINSEVIDAFTTGHCHSFAIAMNQLTGWKIYGTVGPYDYDNSPSHVFVKHPSGRFVDVTGFMDSNSNGKYWLRSIYKHKPIKDAYNLDAYFGALPEFAMPYVKTVLANVGGLMSAGAKKGANRGKAVRRASK